MSLVRLAAASAAHAVLAAGALFSAGALAQDVIRIGYPLPITGPLSPEAKKLQNGANLWAEMQNKAGGIKVGAKRVNTTVYNGLLMPPLLRASMPAASQHAIEQNLCVGNASQRRWWV